MQMVPLTNVYSSAMIRAEHVISIMACSYTIQGGLNGVSGSDTKDVTKGVDQPQKCWDMGLSAIAAQGVVAFNIETYHSQLRIDRHIKSVREQLDEVNNMKAELRKSNRKDIGMWMTEMKAVDKYLEKAITEFVEEQSLFSQVLEDWKFLLEADELLEEFPEFVEDSQR
jgi:hypothetical protein